MQGRKTFTPKLFQNFSLMDAVPQDNFYRRLDQALDLNFMYFETRDLYGDTGNPSIDPVVFFKLSLVGCLENIISDHELIRFCSMRLDVLLFLGYDIDEKLPWHSTVSRTRQLYAEPVFEKLFNRIFTMCVGAGMVKGEVQASDSALVKANASLESLEQRNPVQPPSDHSSKVRALNAQAGNKTVTGSGPEIQNTSGNSTNQSPAQKQSADQTAPQDKAAPQQKKQKKKGPNNKTHYSTTDPDSRIAVKPGKACKLSYLAGISVDTAHHVITHIQADFADKKDSQCYQELVTSTRDRLEDNELSMKVSLADTNYSSGGNYRFLEDQPFEGYIPAHGRYKRDREGFIYDKENDRWTCAEGKHLSFYKEHTKAGGDKKRVYKSELSDCRDCPLKNKCIAKAARKVLEINADKDLYDSMIDKMDTITGKAMVRKRHSTVEPVFGSLINYTGMGRINVRGIEGAGKVMQMSGAAYNLKKWMKFTFKKVQTGAAQAIKGTVNRTKYLLNAIRGLFKASLNPVPVLE